MHTKSKNFNKSRSEGLVVVRFSSEVKYLIIHLKYFVLTNFIHRNFFIISIIHPSTLYCIIYLKLHNRIPRASYSTYKYRTFYTTYIHNANIYIKMSISMYYMHTEKRLICEYLYCFRHIIEQKPFLLLLKNLILLYIILYQKT